MKDPTSIGKPGQTWCRACDGTGGTYGRPCKECNGSGYEMLPWLMVNEETGRVLDGYESKAQAVREAARLSDKRTRYVVWSREDLAPGSPARKLLETLARGTRVMEDDLRRQRDEGKG